VSINVNHCKDEMEETHRKLFGDETAPAAETGASDEERTGQGVSGKEALERGSKTAKIGGGLSSGHFGYLTN
jgi:hypothetical protein